MLHRLANLERALRVKPRMAFEHDANVGPQRFAHGRYVIHDIVNLPVGEGPVPDLAGIPAAGVIVPLHDGVDSRS